MRNKHVYSSQPRDTLDLDQFKIANQKVIRDLVWDGKGRARDLPGDDMPGWKSLQIGSWLNDHANSEACTIVNAADGNVGMFNGFSTKKIKDGSVDVRLLKEPKMQKMREKDKLVFQDNLDQNHWRVFVYSKPKRTLRIYDSLVSGLSPASRKSVDLEADPTAMKLGNWIRRNVGPVGDDVTYKGGLPLQPDYASCGAYSVMYMLSNAVSKPLPDQMNSVDVREFVGNFLLEGDQAKTPAEKAALLRDLRFEPP